MPRQPYSIVADANGAATVTVRPRDAAGWDVLQVSVEMTRGTAATLASSAVCAMRVNGFLICYLIAQGDAAGDSPSVPLQSADVLTLEWTGCNPGNVCAALIMYTGLGA